MNVKTRIAIVILITAAAASAYTFGRTENRYSDDFFDFFDTVTEITAYTKSREEFDELSAFVRERLEFYHRLYDIYNEYDGINNLKTVNGSAGQEPVKVDEKIIELIEFAVNKHTLTGGKFNIAIGPVTRIWHDYRSAGNDTPAKAALPPHEMLAQAAEHTDIEKIVIDRDSMTLFLSEPIMSLDVGAVAKGYAVERICAEVQARGYKSFLINAGGNIRAAGGKGRAGEPWKVGVQNPADDADSPVICMTELRDMALVTSGDYRRAYEVDGKQYHHIIDPDTLYPADYYHSVTVASSDSGTADVLSTACFCMPLEEGLELINAADGFEAMWILKNGEIVYSDGFEKILTQ